MLKSAMGRPYGVFLYCLLLFFFFSFFLVCPSPDSSIILREKKQMADAQTQNLDPVMHTLGM
jgi:hypothetical protein